MARQKTFMVSLSDEQRERLESLITKGHASARVIRRAHTLLLGHEGHPNHQIARMLHIDDNTVSTTNKRFALEGLDAALSDRPRPGAERKLDGRGEAQLIAIACGKAPNGQARWSLRQLTQQLIQLQVVEDISYETVRRTLKKTHSNLG